MIGSLKCVKMKRNCTFSFMRKLIHAKDALFVLPSLFHFCLFRYLFFFFFFFCAI